MNHETYNTKIKTWEHYSLSVSMLGSFTWKTTDLLQLRRDRDHHSQCQDNIEQLLKEVYFFLREVDYPERRADLLREVQIFWGRCRSSEVQMGRCSSSEGGAHFRSSEGGAHCRSSEGGSQYSSEGGAHCRSSEGGADLVGDSGGRCRSSEGSAHCRSSEGGADLLTDSGGGADLLMEVQMF